VETVGSTLEVQTRYKNNFIPKIIDGILNILAEKLKSL